MKPFSYLLAGLLGLVLCLAACTWTPYDNRQKERRAEKVFEDGMCAVYRVPIGSNIYLINNRGGIILESQ